MEVERSSIYFKPKLKFLVMKSKIGASELYHRSYRQYAIEWTLGGPILTTTDWTKYFCLPIRANIFQFQTDFPE